MKEFVVAVGDCTMSTGESRRFDLYGESTQDMGIARMLFNDAIRFSPTWPIVLLEVEDDKSEVVGWHGPFSRASLVAAEESLFDLGVTR